MNPTLPESVVERALERDRAAATAEYLAEFRSDIESFVSLDRVEACVDPGVAEKPPLGHRYVAFCDPSGGSQDAMTLAIGHDDDDRAVIDAVREVRPPFSPQDVVEQFCAVLSRYSCATVVGDRYAGAWVAESFAKRGIDYKPSEKTKSELYGELLPAINGRSILLLDIPRVVSQIAGLERRTSRGGKDSIDHGPGGHDDVANAVAGAAFLAVDGAKRHVSVGSYNVYTGQIESPDDDDDAEYERNRMFFDAECKTWKLRPPRHGWYGTKGGKKRTSSSWVGPY